MTTTWGVRVLGILCVSLGCAACNNMGCADGLKIVSKTTYANNASGATAMYQDESEESASGATANPDGGGWHVNRDAKSSSDSDNPKLICVKDDFPTS